MMGFLKCISFNFSPHFPLQMSTFVAFSNGFRLNHRLQSMHVHEVRRSIHFATARSRKKGKMPPSNVPSTSKLLPTSIDDFAKCQLEFTSGAGGVEAMLFTQDLFEMYHGFARRMGWNWRPIEKDVVDLGGLRSAIVSVAGDQCFAKLRWEGGVHRVQRVPVTDRTRMHTSTASVAVLPEPDNPEVVFAPGEVHQEICKSSGAGGMNVNANPTAVRLTHMPTGLQVKAQDERYVEINKRLAFQRLSAILLQREMDETARRFAGSRRLQMGSLARAEKIRTYNSKDNRVTDHRLQHSVHGVQEFLSGGEALETMVLMLQQLYIEEQKTKEKCQPFGKTGV